MQSPTTSAITAVGAVDGTARIALLVVVVLLVAIVAAVAALAIVMRRRTARPAEAGASAVPPGARGATGGGAPVASRARRAPTPGLTAAGGLAVATSGMICPTCRTEYTGLTYCTRDARRLVPAEEMLAGNRSAGGVCVSCRRAFEPGLRRCPHDNSELVPATVAAALRGRPKDAPTGVLAKACPGCRQKFDLAARFCGHDGTELVVVN